jgi:hypothetical protein
LVHIGSHNRFRALLQPQFYIQAGVSFMLLLFTLADAGDKERLPLVTATAQ